MLHTSLAAFADVLSSVIAFILLGVIIRKKQGAVKGNLQIVTVEALHCHDK